ncbi:hypothetical protein DL96DRAFT_1716834 [Flagelloscypha sp. PMI_526]|nr:hypothetical protein DL96DRAFT_1716834 [Flagelloscypha sp. PMI_526]
MRSPQDLPPELYPAILQHVTIEDLKSCVLVNSFFQGLAQSALFLHVRVVCDVPARMEFFGSPRGSQLIKQAKSLSLGYEFWKMQDDKLVSSFLQSLDHSKIDTAHLSDTPPWQDIPGPLLRGLYVVLMPRLHSLTFDNSGDIPLTVVLSHCPMLRRLEFQIFTTAPATAADGIDLKALPNVRHLALTYWDVDDLAETTSLHTYLEAKGTFIESLSLEDFQNNSALFSMNLFPSLKQSLRQLTFAYPSFEELSHSLELNEFRKLERLRFITYIRASHWFDFLDFFHEELEQVSVTSSLQYVQVQVTLDSDQHVDFVNARSKNLAPVSLANFPHLRLHVIIQVDEIIEDGERTRVRAPINEYDQFQQEMEACAWWWLQAGRLAFYPILSKFDKSNAQNNTASHLTDGWSLRTPYLVPGAWLPDPVALRVVRDGRA